MKVLIVTPKGKTFESDKVTQITIPTTEGIVTIMDDHMPLLSVLASGGIEISIEGEKDEVLIAVSQGVLEVRRESFVNILANTAEHAEEIDVERAEAARLKAEEFLLKKDYADEAEFAMIQAKIEKELSRINVARKYRR